MVDNLNKITKMESPVMSVTSVSSNNELDEDNPLLSLQQIMTPQVKRMPRKQADEKKRSKTFLNPTASIASPMRKAQVRLSKINVLAIKQESKTKSSSSLKDDFLEKYEVIEKIGEGAHGLVYKAQGKEQPKEFFAIKTLHYTDQEIFEIEKNEFTILKNLDHVNILKVYEIFHNETQGVIRIVSELIKGVTLSKYLMKNGPFDIKKSQIVFQKVLSALKYLHKKGICHRDIKPSNIMISENLETVKIIDFGVAKVFKKEECKSENITMMTPTGSEFYKAPEFIRGDVYDEKIDVWACGITLFEMVIGVNPVIEVLQAKWKNWTIEDVLNLKTVLKSHIWNEGGSGALKLLLKHMLEINSEKRLSAEEAKNTPFFFIHDVQKISTKKLSKNLNAVDVLGRGPGKDLEDDSLSNPASSLKALIKLKGLRSMSIFNPLTTRSIAKK